MEWWNMLLGVFGGVVLGFICAFVWFRKRLAERRKLTMSLDECSAARARINADVISLEEQLRRSTRSEETLRRDVKSLLSVFHFDEAKNLCVGDIKVADANNDLSRIARLHA